MAAARLAAHDGHSSRVLHEKAVQGCCARVQTMQEMAPPRYAPFASVSQLSCNN